MKKLVFLIYVFILCSCAAQKAVVAPPPPTPEPPAPKPAAKPAIKPDLEPITEIANVKTSKPFLQCDDDTKNQFNNCGLEVLPFIRPLFFDIDNDGIQEMIVGSKDGSLRLYKNSDKNLKGKWELIEGYFDGIRAGAFSSPAVCDIDNDGKPEVIIGTGGFSSESGKVIFYRNTGSPDNPKWEIISMPEIAVGNDATPAAVDVDGDDSPDLVVGNSNGSLYLFRNKSKGGMIKFAKEQNFFKGLNFGMYAAAAAASDENGLKLIIGNALGKLYIIEKANGKNAPWIKSSLNISLGSFASPSFIENGVPGKKDLVVSDGSGRLFYFKNRNSSYREWEEAAGFFTSRIVAGPACTPHFAVSNGKSFMVIGNINGEIKLFEYLPSSDALPWVERSGFFNGIKLQGFSRGALTTWNGKDLLIAGQQSGILRAFINYGTTAEPVWREQKSFFASLPRMPHASPFLFDIDGDGKWELIVGDENGYVRGFSCKTSGDGKPVWKSIDEYFGYVKVERFAAPTLFSYGDRLYLLVGQQDGRVTIFTADKQRTGYPVFLKDGYLSGIKVNNHSSPSAYVRNGKVELSIGDYHGNLRHFICKNSS